MMIHTALFDGPGLPFRIVEVPRPTLADGEILVRVTLATICGSDLHTVAGSRTESTPCVLGHEAVGIVEAVTGEIFNLDGEAVRIGDRVVWTVAASCGVCERCCRGLPQKCLNLKKYGHVRHDNTHGPSGGFASHVHLWTDTGIVTVPAYVPDTVAAPAACATATVAACRTAATGPSILVLGCGMLGLTACAMAAADGATVLAVDNDPARLARAKAFGATQTFQLPADEARLKSASAALPGGGVAVAYEFTGSSAVTALALDRLRTGGTLILAGAVFPTEPLAVAPEMLIRRMLTIRGVHNYTPSDLRTAVRFLTEQHANYPFAELIDSVFPLDEINAAVAHARTSRAVRIGITNCPSSVG